VEISADAVEEMAALEVEEMVEVEAVEDSVVAVIAEAAAFEVVVVVSNRPKSSGKLVTTIFIFIFKMD